SVCTWSVLGDYFAEDDGEMVPRTSHTAAFLSDTKDRGPPVQSQIWRSGEKVPFVQTYSLRAFEKPPQVQTQALRDFEKAWRVCMIIKRLLKTKPLNSCVVLVGGARMLTPCRAPQNCGVLSKGQPACMFPFIER
uniref:Phosphodiesterase 4D interacting protein n=1 Tax=Mandrillus leucophaeus TaxID=9568 RepID=A0A2K5Z6S4_MANLE